VRRINKNFKDTHSDGTKVDLVVGEEYTVSITKDGSVELEGCSSFTFMSANFELVKTPPLKLKEGERVLRTGRTTASVTKGESYVIRLIIGDSCMLVGHDSQFLLSGFEGTKHTKSTKPLPDGMNAKELGFKVGDKFEVVIKNNQIEVGDIVTLTRDDTSWCPWFTPDVGRGKGGTDGTICINFKRLIPIGVPSTPTEPAVTPAKQAFARNKNAEALGLSVGEKFEVLDTGMHKQLKIGDIVEFVRDDHSICPTFSVPSGGTRYIGWHRLCPAVDVPSTPTEPVFPFKLGDHVRYDLHGEDRTGILVALDAKEWEGATFGSDHGHIIELTDGGSSGVSDGHWHCKLDASYFNLLPAFIKPMAEPAPEPEYTGEFPIGSTVRRTGYSRSNVDKGELYTVATGSRKGRLCLEGKGDFTFEPLNFELVPESEPCPDCSEDQAVCDASVSCLKVKPCDTFPVGTIVARNSVDSGNHTCAEGTPYEVIPPLHGPDQNTISLKQTDGEEIGLYPRKLRLATRRERCNYHDAKNV
jgi:hypothetical protein